MDLERLITLGERRGVIILRDRSAGMSTQPFGDRSEIGLELRQLTFLLVTLVRASYPAAHRPQLGVAEVFWAFRIVEQIANPFLAAKARQIAGSRLEVLVLGLMI